MNVNKRVIASTLIIMGVGIINAWTSTPPQGITRVVVGGYILMLMLSIIDLFGGGFAQVADALSLLAVVFVLLHELLPILQRANILAFGTPSAGGEAPLPPSLGTDANPPPRTPAKPS